MPKRRRFSPMSRRRHALARHFAASASTWSFTPRRISSIARHRAATHVACAARRRNEDADASYAGRMNLPRRLIKIRLCSLMAHLHRAFSRNDGLTGRMTRMPMPTVSIRLAMRQAGRRRRFPKYTPGWAGKAAHALIGDPLPRLDCFSSSSHHISAAWLAAYYQPIHLLDAQRVIYADGARALASVRQRQ